MGWCIYLSISNGALMQVLIGSLCSDNRLPQANAIISFNNKPAADAVPFFDQMGPTMVQVAPLIEASPVTNFARAFTAEVIRAVLDSRIPLPPAVGDNLQSIRQFLDQIPAVFNQVLQFMFFHDLAFCQGSWILWFTVS
jgi:hypothetical protein